MSGGVDPASQAGDHDDPAATERGGKVTAKAPAVGRSVARADDRHHRALQQLGPTKHRQDRRRVVDGGKRTRIVGLAPADHSGAGAVQGSQFGLGFGPAHRGDGPGALAAAGELRHHFERCPGGAEAAQHGEEADRADRLGAA